MARALRIQFAGAYYHVACRGNERRAIFKDDTDRVMFLERLERSLEIYDVRLLCYALMPNHFHLLIQTLAPNLSEFMRHFNVTYTMAFNKQHQRSGHLYQGRYHATVVERDSYLMELSRYLHLNPVRAKTVTEGQSVESALTGYRWSSYCGYIQLRRREVFVDYSDVLDFFGGDTVRGRREYARFVCDGIKNEAVNPFREIVGQLILGSNEFVERLKEQFLPHDESAREKPAVRKMRFAQESEHVLMEAAAALGTEIEQLTRRGKRTAERGMAMELLHRHCGLSQPEIGKLFGGLDYSSVSVNRKKFFAALEHDERLRHAHREALRRLQNQE